MIRCIKSFMALVVVCIMSGCATTSSYVQPQTNVPHATIQGGEVRESLFTWRVNSIITIDDKAVNNFFTNTPKLRIQPGKHNMVASVTFARGFASQQYNALVEFDANIKAREVYKITSAIKGKSVQVWAEDAHGRRAGTVGSANYSVLPQSQTVIVPVYSR